MGQTATQRWSRYARVSDVGPDVVRRARVEINFEVLAVPIAHVSVHDAHIGGNLDLVASLDDTAVVVAVAVTAGFFPIGGF